MIFGYVVWILIWGMRDRYFLNYFIGFKVSGSSEVGAQRGRNYGARKKKYRRKIKAKEIAGQGKFLRAVRKSEYIAPIPCRVGVKGVCGEVSFYPPTLSINKMFTHLRY
jgi:hypothetical protein